LDSGASWEKRYRWRSFHRSKLFPRQDQGSDYNKRNPENTSSGEKTVRPLATFNCFNKAFASYLFDSNGQGIYQARFIHKAVVDFPDFPINRPPKLSQLWKLCNGMLYDFWVVRQSKRSWAPGYRRYRHRDAARAPEYPRHKRTRSVSGDTVFCHRRPSEPKVQTHV
jgi:hypothetical protein